MGFESGNTAARKPAADKSESFLHIRCRRADKAAWVTAAGGHKLAAWVTSVLNEAASKTT